MSAGLKSITTHVLDTARGRPASGVPVALHAKDLAAPGGWREIGRGETDADGRNRALVPEGTRLAAGLYRMSFDTGAYFQKLRIEAFYPEVAVVFHLRDPEEHHHVPLLLSPFGFSTYRGS